MASLACKQVSVSQEIARAFMQIMISPPQSTHRRRTRVGHEATAVVDVGVDGIRTRTSLETPSTVVDASWRGAHDWRGPEARQETVRPSPHMLSMCSEERDFEYPGGLWRPRIRFFSLLACH